MPSDGSFVDGTSTQVTDVAQIVQPLVFHQVTCETGTQVDEIEVVASGGTVLRYDSQFIDNWKTPVGASKWYRVTVSIVGGAVLQAYSKMK